jgi:hypothetical protein
MFCAGIRAQNNGNGNGNGTGNINSSAWKIGGDNPATKGILGTINNKGIGIKTNNIERISILENGKIGIHTDAPTEVFDINGNLRIRSNSLIEKDLTVGEEAVFNGDVKFNNLISNRIGFLYVDLDGKVRRFKKGDYCDPAPAPGLPFWNIGGNHIDNPEEEFIGVCNENDLAFRVGGTEKMRITHSGLFGFGTKNPQSTFDFRGVMAISDRLGIGTTAPVSGLHYRMKDLRFNQICRTSIGVEYW